MGILNTSVDKKIAQLTEGELQSFFELYRSYAGPVRGVLYRLAPVQCLDDLVQETFVKIWKGLPKFEGRSSLKVWIFRIAHRVAIDALRRTKPVEFHHEIEKFSENGDENKILQKNLVQWAMMNFSIEHRSVLVLFFMEGFSLQEISSIEGIPVGTVKSRLHFAKKKMLESLQQEGNVW